MNSSIVIMKTFSHDFVEIILPVQIYFVLDL